MEHVFGNLNMHFGFKMLLSINIKQITIINNGEFCFDSKYTQNINPLLLPHLLKLFSR